MTATNITIAFETFTTKEEYLQFRKNWSEAYQQTVNNIRKLKLDMKQAHREGKSGGAIWNIQRAMLDQHVTIQDLRTRKTYAKAEAQRQYLAEKAEATV